MPESVYELSSSSSEFQLIKANTVINLNVWRIWNYCHSYARKIQVETHEHEWNGSIKTWNPTYNITIIINCHMPLHSSAERANDNGPENETSSPNQQQHPTGLSSRDCVLGQPSFILWKVFQLLGLCSSKKFAYFYFDFMIVFSTASSVHLRLITFQRLIAIKFTMQYSNKIANNNLKVAVAAIWVNAFICGILNLLKIYVIIH